MASLDLRNRWFPYTPTWLDNRKSEAPFKMRIKRLTVGELDAFRERAEEVGAKLKTTSEELLSLFGGVVEGPIGALEINGEEVVDLPGLMRFAAMECPILESSLTSEIILAVITLNTLTQEAAGN